MSGPDAWGGGPEVPPRMLANPKPPRRGLRRPLALSVLTGFLLILAGLVLQLQPGLVEVGGIVFIGGLLVTAGGLWASYYIGPT